MSVQIINTEINTFHKAMAFRDNSIWDALSNLTVLDAYNDFVKEFHELTKISYQQAFRLLYRCGLINPNMTLQEFSLVNHERVLDAIRLEPRIKAAATKQARAAAYVSFTGYLARRFPHFKKAIPVKYGANRTFYKIREHVVCEAMNPAQWNHFLSALSKHNPRDALIAKVMLQGAKRVNEVLSVTIDKINWEKREITFRQSKTRNFVKEQIITYPESIIKDIKDYIGDRTEGYIFITSKGRKLLGVQLNRSFALVGKRANMPFKIIPKMFRTSAVTHLRHCGFNDADIMKVTGHATSEMIKLYDKTSKADNASKKINLVS